MQDAINDLINVEEEIEYEADNYAVNLLHKSKYNPQAFVTLLEKLKQWDSSPKWLEIISTHPHLYERINNINKQKISSFV